ncbi:MAG TPA: hypothetical protein VGH17_04035 [Candidatus Acidoferrales bacterium]|jgi:hypothetical protein
MEALIDFVGVGGAIVFSLGVALSLEWFALNTLMKMMPVQQPVMVADEVTSNTPAAGPTLVPASFAGSKRAA